MPFQTWPADQVGQTDTRETQDGGERSGKEFNVNMASKQSRISLQLRVVTEIGI